MTPNGNNSIELKQTFYNGEEILPTVDEIVAYIKAKIIAGDATEEEKEKLKLLSL